jgi:hypothetical protein
MVGPRPSTHVSCTIGGMIGNNACGSTAQACGKMADSVRHLDVLLYHGLRTWTGETSDAEYQRILAGGGRKADICQRLREIQMAHLAEIRTGYPDIPRRVSGYNLDYLLPEKETAVGKTQTREGARYRRLARCRGKAKAQVALGNTQLRVYPKLLSTPGCAIKASAPATTSASATSAARSPTTSASSAPSARSHLLPHPRTRRTGTYGRLSQAPHLIRLRLTLHRMLPRAQLRIHFRVREPCTGLSSAAPPARHDDVLGRVMVPADLALLSVGFLAP